MSTQRKWLWAAAILIVGGTLLAFGVGTETMLIVGLLLLCPLMMLFMMGGKDMHQGSKGDQSGESSDKPRR